MRKALPAIARVLAVTLGAYVLTSLTTAALSLLLARLGVARIEAVTAATLASFAIFAVAAMAASHARSPARALGWQALLAAPAGVLILLLSGSPS